MQLTHCATVTAYYWDPGCTCHSGKIQLKQQTQESNQGGGNMRANEYRTVQQLILQTYKKGKLQLNYGSNKKVSRQ